MSHYYQRTRSVDDFASMYEAVRVQAPCAERPAADESERSSPSDVTSAPQSPASTPTLDSLDFSDADDDVQDDADDTHESSRLEPLIIDYDTLEDDLADIPPAAEAHQNGARHPAALPHPPSMAEDFSEGRLETFVGKPQKELPGTKDAYVSYLVTTKVGICRLSPNAL